MHFLASWALLCCFYYCSKGDDYRITSNISPYNISRIPKLNTDECKHLIPIQNAHAKMHWGGSTSLQNIFQVFGSMGSKDGQKFTSNLMIEKQNNVFYSCWLGQHAVNCIQNLSCSWHVRTREGRVTNIKCSPFLFAHMVLNIKCVQEHVSMYALHEVFGYQWHFPPQVSELVS